MIRIDKASKISLSQLVRDSNISSGLKGKDWKIHAMYLKSKKSCCSYNNMLLLLLSRFSCVRLCVTP